MTSTLQDAIGAVRQGNYDEAQRQLAEVIGANPQDVQAWYLMSQIVDSDARRAAYLSKTLALNPYHERAWAEFFSLPTDVVAKLEQGPDATFVPVAVEIEEPLTLEPAAVEPVVDVETALPDWLRPVAKDQPVVAQRRAAPAAAIATSAVQQPVVSQTTTTDESTVGNRTLSVLLAILLIATILVLAFLVYLLLQN